MRRRVGVVVGMATALAAAAAFAQSPDGLSHKALKTIGEGRALYLTPLHRLSRADARGGPTEDQPPAGSRPRR